MSETKEIEFYLMIDQDGEFAIDTDQDNLLDKYRDEISETGPAASRVLHFKLNVPTPTIVSTLVTATIGEQKAEDANVNVTIS